MTRGAKQFVGIWAAWAAVAALVASPAVCVSCDLPCCRVADGETDAMALVPGGEPSDCCPLCLATAMRADHCPAEPSHQPCRCQLDARQDQPIVPPKGSTPQVDLAAAATLPAVTGLEMPQDLGVSREYLAATLAVPIRPARILFGVWRD